MVQRAFIIISLVSNVIAAFAFAVPLLKGNKEIVEETETRWDDSAPVRKALVRDRKFTLVGLLFPSIGFSFQIISQFSNF